MNRATATFMFLLAAFGCSGERSSYVDMYRGDFVPSWEGGGLFVPCGSDHHRVDIELVRRFFAQLRADSIHWPANRQPPRDQEGARLFVVLRTPRLVRAPADTIADLFGAEVDSMRQRRATDCPSAALPKRTLKRSRELLMMLTS